MAIPKAMSKHITEYCFHTHDLKPFLTQKFALVRDESSFRRYGQDEPVAKMLQYHLKFSGLPSKKKF